MDQKIRSKRFEFFAFGFSGLVSAAVLFAVAQLVSVFFATSSAPFVALGSTFIDFTPPWLKDFAIATFGTNDKLALFVSLGIVSIILAALIGLLARRSFRAAAIAILILAAVIGASVITRSATDSMDLVPVILGTVLGLGTLKWLTGLASAGQSAPVEAEFSSGPSRRKFLVASSLSLLGAAIAAGVGASMAATRNAAEAARLALGLPAAKTKAAKIPAGAQVKLKGMPKFVTPNEDFYRIDTALSVPRIDPAEWSLRVHGLVDNEFTMSFEDLLNEELVESYLTLTCVSNPVGGELVGNAKWLGYPLRKLLERAGPQAGADMVLSTSSDGFSASTPLEILTDDRMALLAVGMNDEPLPLEHGFPVRMVVPGLYGYVSATKWVVDLEVTRFGEKDAYWTTRGWSERGPIKMSSRVDVPRSFTKLPPGEVVIGGTAWAQTVGISKVEIKIDDEPWQSVELAEEATLDTWRQWRYVWKGGSPGNHSVTVRAYNTDGEMQTSDRADPVPNGASGWQRVQFSISEE